MPLSGTEYFSDILRELGFVRADEAGLPHTESPYESDRGAFLIVIFFCWSWTFAVDQTGRAWVAYVPIDLTQYGFRSIIQSPHEINSPHWRT